MKPLEIVCESCESRMRLSESLLGKILGKSGRVTCRECSSKILLDATFGTVRVTQGGRLARDLDIEEIEDFTEAPPSVDPHLSELPLVPVATRAPQKSSVPPPLPVEARAQSMRARISGAGASAQAVHTSVKADLFEAPVPHLTAGGSLTPVSLEDDDDGLVPLGREFNSSPFASERDQSYNSLFPRAEPKVAPLDLEAPIPYLSKAPAPPHPGEVRRLRSEPDLILDEISTAPAVAATIVEMGPDGQLINQADKKARRVAAARSNQWVPWTVAAIALLGLGVSVSLDRHHAPAVIKAPEPITQSSAGQAPAPTASVKAEIKEVEPAAAVVEAREVSVVASLPQGAENTAASTAEAPAAAPTEKTRAPAAATLEAPALEAQAEASEQTSREADGSAASSEETESEGDIEEPVLSPFSSAAAATALREATALAGACRKPGDPSGTAELVVTFAPSGRVTRAAVTGAPFAGTETGGCIASRFRTARVPAFAGEHVTVTKTVTIQ